MNWIARREPEPVAGRDEIGRDGLAAVGLPLREGQAQLRLRARVVERGGAHQPAFAPAIVGDRVVLFLPWQVRIST